MDHFKWSGEGQRCVRCERPLPTEDTDPDDTEPPCDGLAGCIPDNEIDALVLGLRRQLAFERVMRMADSGHVYARTKSADLLRQIAGLLVTDQVRRVDAGKFMHEIANRLEPPPRTMKEARAMENVT